MHFSPFPLAIIPDVDILMEVVEVTILNDGIAEETEVFFLSLFSTDGAVNVSRTLDTVTVSIESDGDDGMYVPAAN